MTYGYSKRSVDKNHPDIVSELRARGFTVHDSHPLAKFVDIVVGYKGRKFLFEIKTDNKKKLTKDEKKFFDNCTGQVDVIYSAMDAMTIIFAECPPFE